MRKVQKVKSCSFLQPKVEDKQQQPKTYTRAIARTNDFIFGMQRVYIRRHEQTRFM